MRMRWNEGEVDRWRWAMTPPEEVGPGLIPTGGGGPGPHRGRWAQAPLGEVLTELLRQR